MKAQNTVFGYLNSSFQTLLLPQKHFYFTSNDTFCKFTLICQSAWAALRISLRLLLLTGGYSEPYRPTDQSKTSLTDRRLFRALRSPTDQSKTSPTGGF